MEKIFKKQFQALFDKDLQISKSYFFSKNSKMFGSRLRFSIDMFIDILDDIIFSDLKQKQIQSKYLELYRETRNRIEPFGKSNAMDISAFKQYFRLKKVNEIRQKKYIFNKLKSQQKKKFLYEYINWIITTYYYDHENIIKKWNHQYLKKVKLRNSDQPLSKDVNPYEKEAFIQNTISNSKIKKVKLSAIRHDIKKTSFSLNQDKLNKIGQIGEEIVYNILQRKFGVQNVVWLRGVGDEIAAYDIKYRDLSGDEYYVEVKSTSALKDCVFYLSRNEYDFYTQNKTHYKMIFVSNVTFDKNRTALIRELNNINIELSLKQFGYDAKKDLLYLTPSEFKGVGA